ncbi:hypothetical protein BC831DRAFT_453034 [Entophlyctis helioformis]|nr:hypothetical protein BC831DRAFT_453034 [Entophlyctis helioformis]
MTAAKTSPSLAWHRMTLFADGAVEGRFHVAAHTDAHTDASTDAWADAWADAAPDCGYAHLSPAGLVLVIEPSLLSLGMHGGHSPDSTDSTDGHGGSAVPVPAAPAPAAPAPAATPPIDTPPLRMLASAVPSRWRPVARELVRFRNRFVSDAAAHVPLDLLDRDEQGRLLKTSSPIEMCRWPTSLSDSSRQRRVVESVDGIVRLQVDAHMQTFVVRYPALVDTPPLDADQQHPSSLTRRRQPLFTYTQMEQSHPVRHPPLWCRPALALLGLCDPMPAAAHAVQLPYTAVWIPQTQPALSHPSNAAFNPSHAAHADPSCPKPVSVVATRSGVFRVLRHHPTAAMEVQVLLHADPSVCLCTNDEFTFISLHTAPTASAATVAEHDDAAGETMVYKMFDPPPVAHHPQSGAVLPLHAVIRECLDIYYNTTKCETALWTPKSRAIADQHPLADAGTVVETVEVPGLGHFTAFGDGRVRVAFDDRVVLELDAKASGFTSSTPRQGLCTVIDRYGDEVVVRAERPVGFVK